MESELKNLKDELFSVSKKVSDLTVSRNALNHRKRSSSEDNRLVEVKD
jgi:hypothetical protein